MRTLVVTIGTLATLILAGCGKGSQGHSVNLPTNVLYRIDHGYTCYIERRTNNPDQLYWYCERV